MTNSRHELFVEREFSKEMYVNISKNNPYETMIVYICRNGHVSANRYSPFCYYCWKEGNKDSQLLEAKISKISKQQKVKSVK